MLQPHHLGDQFRPFYRYLIGTATGEAKLHVLLLFPEQPPYSFYLKQLQGDIVVYFIDINRLNAPLASASLACSFS